MGKSSPAFTNMRRALFDAVRQIPLGHVAEVSDLALALNIPARHVAYLLARLTPDEAELVPWQRVVPRAGDFGPGHKRSARQQDQMARLAGEGLVFSENRYLDIKAGQFWRPDDRHRNTLWADVDDPS